MHSKYGGYSSVGRGKKKGRGTAGGKGEEEGKEERRNKSVSVRAVILNHGCNVKSLGENYQWSIPLLEVLKSSAILYATRNENRCYTASCFTEE